MAELAIVIPSKTERFLTPTIRDVLARARGDIKVYPVLDGYGLPVDEYIADERVYYIHLDATPYAKKRHAINMVANLAQCKYLMCLDAHCMLAEGFDIQLIHDHQPDWVQTPRRHRLDAENWCIQEQQDDRPPIDYEYFLFPFQPPTNSPREPKRGEFPMLRDFKWDARTRARWSIPIDQTMTFQGSCWFMEKAWYERCGFMRIEGYTGWGAEAEELGLTTRLYGGDLIVNKNTWVAHLHKGSQYGRMYHLPKESSEGSNKYAYNLWVRERRAFFKTVVDMFWPLPNWPSDWERILYDLGDSARA